MTSDRWWAYSHLPLARRQLCWAHLQRDFTAHAEGLAAEKEFGEHGLGLCERVFWAWEVFQHTHDRASSSARSASCSASTSRSCAATPPKRPRYKYCRGMARNLLKAWPALWTFAAHHGVEPTNNHAERALRGAVIYRKLSLGSQSAATASNASSACSPPTPPAAYNTARCSPTSPTPSPPTPAATQYPCSPEPPTH